jgi:hypothetical protein
VLLYCQLPGASSRPAQSPWATEVTPQTTTHTSSKRRSSATSQVGVAGLHVAALESSTAVCVAGCLPQQTCRDSRSPQAQPDPCQLCGAAFVTAACLWNIPFAVKRRLEVCSRVTQCNAQIGATRIRFSATCLAAAQLSTKQHTNSPLFSSSFCLDSLQVRLPRLCQESLDGTLHWPQTQRQR